MKRFMFALVTAIWLIGSSSMTFADEMGKMKGEMQGGADKTHNEMKGKAKSEMSEMKGKTGEMKSKSGEMKEGKAGEMKDSMKGGK